ncbi:hypothetical protein BELL_1529g00010 [Botrytis elliptica]|uniref:Uncharacterized protein n=1 Tax=Botrytis elliptica TaxID=278938 RepID=A0A4Z1I0B3_9HELO|nr:hypothetical protein BELL_1529g00010 [Botrytis elliptica]
MSELEEIRRILNSTPPGEEPCLSERQWMLHSRMAHLHANIYNFTAPATYGPPSAYVASRRFTIWYNALFFKAPATYGSPFVNSA